MCERIAATGISGETAGRVRLSRTCLMWVNNENEDDRDFVERTSSISHIAFPIRLFPQINPDLKNNDNQNKNNKAHSKSEDYNNK